MNAACVEGCVECAGDANQCIRWSTDTGIISCLEKNCFCDSQGNCQTCLEGYEFIGGKCVVQCPDNCDQCASPKSCTNCSDGYKLFKNGCASELFHSPIIHLFPHLVCPDTCSECSSDNICSACTDGYFLNGTACSKCVDGCARCDNSTWTACGLWEGSSKSCYQNSPGCRYCDSAFTCFSQSHITEGTHS